MAIDNKYGKLDIPGIPDDEPVFVLRAQDKSSIAIIQRYANWHRGIEEADSRPSDEWFASLDEVMASFFEWQHNNADKVKVAD